MTESSETSWKVVGHEGCENEPIDKPDAIQARGWLFAADRVHHRLTHVSSNLHAPLARALGVEGLQGAPLEEVAPATKLPPAVARLEAIDGLRCEMEWLTADPVLLTAHLTDDHYIVEIEHDSPSVAADPTAVISALLQAPSWQAFCEHMVQALAEMFGYARTMAYTFHPDNHGEVTAEYCNDPDLESYLGLHYPASDIPPQARRLYVLQRVRVIDDVNGPTADLLRPDLDTAPAPALDLTYAHRRAVSPVHLEYMRNMGVAATATISVLHGEQLTGMFVMHDTAPRSLSHSDRLVLATLSRIASFVAATMDEKAFGNRRARVTQLAEGLRRNLTAGDDAIQCITVIGKDMMAAVEADGMAVRLGRDVYRLGEVPDQGAIDNAVGAMGPASAGLVYLTNRLAIDMPQFGASDRCAGAFVARLPGAQEGYLVWFRRPFLDTVRWGGDASATVRKDELGRLHPRNSFHEFVEKVTDRSRMWSEHDRIAADALYQAVQSGVRERAYRQLASQATVDPLTGLGNRRALIHAIDGEIQFRDGADDFALLFLDLDRFKQINDVYGHHKGDLVLKATADRLERVAFYLVGRSARVYRLGGDEFVVLLREATPVLVSHVADRILTAFRDPVTARGIITMVNVSIGLVVGENVAGEDAVELLRRGDLAMYSAKRAGGSQVAFYEGDFSHPAVRRSILEQQLYQAIERDELIPAFQPVTSLRTGRVVGVEALARWRQPDGDCLLPDQFIPLAEETWQIRALDRRIAEHAVAQCQPLLRDTSREFHLSVNASVKTVDTGYVDFLADLIARFEVPPERLTIELTESAMVHEAARLKQVLSSVRTLGMKVAIDDFGTGYSSLAHLQDLPVDVIKLDRVFVERPPDGRDTNVVARWAMQLVSDLGLRMIGEGVETPEQKETLSALGYDWLQGNLFGRPAFGLPPTK